MPNQSVIQHEMPHSTLSYLVSNATRDKKCTFFCDNNK